MLAVGQQLKQVDAAYPFSVMSPSCVPSRQPKVGDTDGGAAEARRGSRRVTMTYLQLTVQLGEPRPELSIVFRHDGQQNSALLSMSCALCLVRD